MLWQIRNVLCEGYTGQRTTRDTFSGPMFVQAKVFGFVFGLWVPRKMHLTSKNRGVAAPIRVAQNTGCRTKTDPCKGPCFELLSHQFKPYKP